MNILIIGGGGREHAIAKKLSQSPRVNKLWCAPGNGGISKLAECVNIKATDIGGVLEFCHINRPDLVVVAPDDPLVMGMVDKLNDAGIPAFGPTASAAAIEGSKEFAKDFMRKFNIPTAEYAVFGDFDAAKAYILEKGAPIVIKADGLALGKGVTVAMSINDALDALRRAMCDKVFGKSGERVVIEEYMTGPEVSLLCFTDGETVVPMPSAQDHKRVYDGDRGPNTGGMGAFSPSRYLTPELKEICMRDIVLPTVRNMAACGRAFRGVLYFGLMLTESGPRVVEYNARFGDPETQAVLPLLKTDLAEIMLAIVGGRLKDIQVEWEDMASCCVVLASGGYPGKYEAGYPISGTEDAESLGAVVFHAGTRLEEDGLVTAGGRVLGVTATAATLDEAIKNSYAAADCISFKDLYKRSDIGVK